MKITSSNLELHLTTLLKSIYIVSGDEPFQIQQATQLIRTKAESQGFCNRELLFVEKGFNWNDFAMSKNSLSLFSEKKIIELRMPNAKPGKEGAKFLLEFCESINDETLLLIVCDKLEKSTTQTKWYKAVEKVGVNIAVWPIEGPELKRWIIKQFGLRHLTLSDVALQLFSNRIEGNLLAADQEIEKLRLLSTTDEIDEKFINQSVADSARYDLFKLIDEALIGDLTHTSHILYGLKHEGMTPILVNWALLREIRSLLKMKTKIDAAQGVSVESVMSQNRVWDNRKTRVGAALNRHSLASLQALLRRANRTDRIIKGNELGNIWDELLQLSLGIAGLRYLPNVSMV